MKKIINLNNKSGSTPVIIICTTLVVLLASALIADIGYAAFENYKLNKSAERAAVYGARTLIQKQSDVEEAVRKLVIKSINNLNELDIRVSDNSKEITVSIEKPFKYFFLQLVGFKEKQIKAKCTARVSNINSVIGIRPFAIGKQKFIYGKDVILSNAKTKGGAIPFIPLNLGEGNYKANIIYGYRNLLHVGDGIFSLKGKIQDETLESFKTMLKKSANLNNTSERNEIDEEQAIIVPVVDKFDASGTKPMNILGFTAFYVQKCELHNGNVQLKGKFIRRVIEGDTSDGASDFGLIGIRLIH